MKNAFKDISYTAQSDEQTLDLYLPSYTSGPYPVVIWLHPGGYTAGDKRMVEPVLDSILNRGYALASVNYRLADKVCFPAQIYDAKATVRWIRANAEKFNLNKKAVAAWGVSAGSTFAALLGTSANNTDLEDLSMGNPDESNQVSAVVALIGPMDLLQMDPQLIQLGYEPIHDFPTSGTSMLVGGQLSDFPEICRAINPATYITFECPPFYIQHGKKDHVVPYLQSVDFARALTDIIGQEKVVLNLIENVDHFDREHNSAENVNKALDFLDMYLKY